MKNTSYPEFEKGKWEEQYNMGPHCLKIKVPSWVMKEQIHFRFELCRNIVSQLQIRVPSI